MSFTTPTPWLLAAALVLGGCFDTSDDKSDEDDEDDDFFADGGSGGGGETGGGEEGGGEEGGGSTGADPDADDDGDGFTNAEEEEAGTNPDYEYSHPYTGDYNVGRCEDGVASGTPGPSGTDSYGGPLYKVGDIAENFSLMDQHGEMVDLYSFCGQTVMLVSGAFW